MGLGVREKCLFSLKKKVVRRGISSSFDLKLTLPAELPSVETALKTLSKASTALETPDLEQAEDGQVIY